MQIPHTLNLICDTWERAEEELISNSEYWLSSGEADITNALTTELTKQFQHRSQDGAFAMAFEQDLLRTYPTLHWNQAAKSISQGLIASITQHTQHTEGITGGDFGLLINRPNIHFTKGRGPRIDDNVRGILCQAKKKQSNGKWGKFTKKQEQILPGQMSYLALALYHYTGRLYPVRWLLASGLAFVDLKNMLRDDEFPDALNSSQLLEMLGRGQCGTPDRRIIAEVIAPDRNPTIEIRVEWPDGPPSDSDLDLFQFTTKKVQQVQYLHR